MGFAQVLRDKVALSFRYGVLLTNDLDASAATCSGGFQNIHVFEVIHLTVVLESLVVFREDVSQRADFEVFAMLSSLLLDIPPQVGLGSETPRTGKVVDFLIFVHASEL